MIALESLGSRYAGKLGWTALALGAVALAYGAGAVWFNPSADPGALVLIVIFGILIALPLLIEKRLDPFSPAIFCMLLKTQWLGKPLIEIFLGEYQNSQLSFLTESEALSLLKRSLGLVILAQMGYLVGYYSRLWKVLPAVRLMGLGELRENRARAAGAILAVAVLAAFAAYVVEAGGWIEMWQAMALRGELYEDVRFLAPLLDLASLPLLLFAAPAILRGRFPRWLIFATLAMVLALAGTGDRSRALLPIVSVAVFCHYLYRRIALSRLVALALIVMSLAIGIQALRRTTAAGGLDLGALDGVAVDPLETLERFYLSRRGIDLVGVMLERVPEALPFQHGMTYVRALAMPVPRALWPDKPLVDESGLVGRALMGDRYYGLPVGTEGVLYLNFHIPGVFLGMLLMAAVHRKIYEQLSGSGAKAAMVILYALCLYKLFSFTGMGLFRLACVILPAWLVLRFVCGPPLDAAADRNR